MADEVTKASLILCGDDSSFSSLSMKGRIPDRIIESVIQDNKDWISQESAIQLRELQKQLKSLEESPSSLPVSEPPPDSILWQSFARWYSLPWSQIPWLYWE